MVILMNTEGRFGHQLSQLVTLLAYSNSYKRPFYQWNFKSRFGANFENSSDLFRYTSEQKIRMLSTYVLFRLVTLFKVRRMRLFNTAFYLQYDDRNELMFDDTISALFREDAAVVVTNYIFNDVPALLSGRSVIRKQLRPESGLRKRTAAFTGGLRQRYTTLLGLHIRRGDFKSFENGRFYFSDYEYRIVLDRFFKLFNADVNNTAVIICSDEPVDLQHFSPYSVFAEQRPYSDDFFILCACDYIIGPRSIFTTMANYFGDNRLYQLFDVNKAFSEDDFLSCEDLLPHYNLKPVQDL
jgi:hypothetical protein